MARNDIILLDKVLETSQEQFGESYEKSELFELFCFDQLLKNYDLSFDEIEAGWVDGKDDGGIDGIYLFLDDSYVTEKPNSKKVRNEPILELVIITCKHNDSFKQEPIANLLATIPEFLDLSKTNDELTADYNEEVLLIRELFRDAYIELAVKNPKLKITYVYACRGNSDEVAENIISRSKLLTNQTEKLFSDSQSFFSYIGAAELLELYRTKKNYSLRLKFIENTISRAKTNYIILSKLSDFFEFITDEQNNLRRYLFESNVRDYLGDVGVNQDIESTLSSKDAESSLDFWWLNNGVTILTSSANVAGKEISLENIQIVNGLQTTETIYKYFSRFPSKDDRAVLVKIIVAKDELLRDKIIRATNNQSPVDIASLRAMDKIQRDIEQILEDNEYYYDRRKNFYKNQGKPAERIISLTYLSSCIQALCLLDLVKASRLKTKFFRDDNEYEKTFNEKWKIEVFLKLVQIQKSIDKELNNFHFRPKGAEKTSARIFKYLFSYIYCVRQLKKARYGPNEILKVDTSNINQQEIETIWQLILDCENDYIKRHGGGRHIRKPHRNQAFHDFIRTKLENQISKNGC